MSITSQEYQEQNRLGFEGDTILKEYVEKLIRDNDIKIVIEGGSYIGSTTKLFAEMVPAVYSIEINGQYFNEAHKYLKDEINKKINLYLGSTLEIMPIILPHFGDTKYLFYSDAHWQHHNPLLEELELIAKFGHKPFIIIHDFKSPLNPELGFDSYNNQDYEWSWIEKSIESIYGKDGFEIEYNKEAVGARRGIISIKPKQA